MDVIRLQYRKKSKKTLSILNKKIKKRFDDGYLCGIVEQGKKYSYST